MAGAFQSWSHDPWFPTGPHPAGPAPSGTAPELSQAWSWPGSVRRSLLSVDCPRQFQILPVPGRIWNLGRKKNHHSRPRGIYGDRLSQMSSFSQPGFRAAFPLQSPLNGTSGQEGASPDFVRATLVSIHKRPHASLDSEDAISLRNCYSTLP